MMGPLQSNYENNIKRVMLRFTTKANTRMSEVFQLYQSIEVNFATFIASTRCPLLFLLLFDN